MGLKSENPKRPGTNETGLGIMDMDYLKGPTNLKSHIGIYTKIGSLIGRASILLILFLLISCNWVDRKSDLDIEFMLDTLDVGYTYWWPESGPFIGNCGQELSLVFVGTITDLRPPTDEAGPLYTPQKGTITIDQVFKIKDLGENTYENQRFVTTDCFYEAGLGTGNKVLVVCYDYEDAYTIPGQGSLIRIKDFDDPVVASVRNYIDADEDPRKIRKDIGLWASHGHGRALEQAISCREEMKNPDEVEPLHIE